MFKFLGCQLTLFNNHSRGLWSKTFLILNSGRLLGITRIAFTEHGKVLWRVCFLFVTERIVYSAQPVNLLWIVQINMHLMLAHYNFFLLFSLKQLSRLFRNLGLKQVLPLHLILKFSICLVVVLHIIIPDVLSPQLLLMLGVIWIDSVIPIFLMNIILLHILNLLHFLKFLLAFSLLFPVNKFVFVFLCFKCISSIWIHWNSERPFLRYQLRIPTRETPIYLNFVHLSVYFLGLRCVQGVLLLIIFLLIRLIRRFFMIICIK